MRRGVRYWESQGIQKPCPLLEYEHVQPNLRDGIALDASFEKGQHAADYYRLGLTLGKHPVALIRHRETFRLYQSGT